MRLPKSILTPLLILFLVILACSSSEQGQIQTQVASVGKTALAEGGEIARTQAAQLKKTAVTIAETQADILKKTALSLAETQVDNLKETASAALGTQLAGGGYERQFPNTSKDDNYLVGAYYYPWYGPGRNHWEDGYAGHPTLGEYDSGARNILNQQIDWAAGHGIDFFAVSWWGPGSREDSVLKDHFLKSPLIQEFQFVILYESAGRLQVSPDGTINIDSLENQDTLLKDLTYLQQEYWHHPQYLKIDGRPVVILYLTRIFTGDISAAFNAIRSTLRANGEDMYLIGDEVYWGNSQSLPKAHIQTFDAVTAYNMHTSVEGIADDFNGKVSQEYAAWEARANDLGVDFIPGILPGFNDTSVRPQANHPPIPRSVGLFESQLDTAFEFLSPRIKLFMITSWNEWHEDTSIEPAQEFGFDYLDALQRKKESQP